jgi:hypothetical protein
MAAVSTIKFNLSAPRTAERRLMLGCLSAYSSGPPAFSVLQIFSRLSRVVAREQGDVDLDQITSVDPGLLAHR